MKNYKTTIAGLIAGLPGIIDAIVQASNAGAFSGKTGVELLTSIAIVILGWLAKDHNVTGGTVKIFVAMLIGCAVLSSPVHAQSVFKPIPQPAKKAAAYNVFSMSLDAAPATDSTFKGFRLAGPSVLYALPNSTVFTGVGVSYEHDTYKQSTGKWYSDWSVNLEGYAGGQFAPANLSGVTAIGLSVSFFNKILTVGVLYNLTNKQVQGAVGPTVSLNN